ncbi:MAG: hypothetical protein IJ064_05460 [Bacteroidaceae bacterium]|nr:hypothetical protein [Bacteroidaceae bacterium]
MAATIDIIGKNGVKHSAVFEDASVRKFELMKEDYVRLVFSTDKRFTINLGDKIVIGESFAPALRGTFEITTPQQPTFNATTGGYDYDLQFDAPHYKWNNKLFKFEPSTKRNEASWSLTDNLRNHMAVFLRNLEFYGWNYTVDESSYLLEAASRVLYIQYNDKYLLDALTQIAEAYGLEWWITDSIIHFDKCESGTAINFELGQNVEDMGAEKSDTEYITRLYGFGSTRNLPPDYRQDGEQVLLNGVVQKRVMLPASTPYVDIVEGLTDDEIVEGIVQFDDVYPHMDCEITELREDVRAFKDEDSEDENATIDVTIFRFKTSGFTFSKDYVLPGQQLQVQFQDGKLAGMIFDVAFNPDDVSETKNKAPNPDAQWFEIVRNETYGVYLPNDTLKPKKGNKFVLLGWNVRKIESGMGLVTAAENEVLERTKEKAKELRTDPNTYPCKMMADYMYGLNNAGKQDANFTKVGSFPLGQRIRLNNDTFFEGGSRLSRVVGYEYKLDKPYDGATIYVGESATYSQKRATENAISDVEDSLSYMGHEFASYGGGGGSVYIITTNDDSTPTDANVYSALRTERQFARKDANDSVSALWTFNHGYGARRGIQTKDYNENGANEDNLFGKGFELVSQTNANGDTRSRLEVDELFVRIKAFFASLEIREMSYVGGNYAFSSAGSKIYYVEWLDASDNVLPKTAGNIGSVYTFRCYLYSDNGTTATINKWEKDDQAMCETFNIDEGVHENVKNKRYWRRVVGIGKGIIQSEQETATDGEETASAPTEYQYVDISMNDCEVGSDYPEAEDTIVQLGNWSNSKRQGLIYLMVEGESAPAIMEYSGVGANGQHFVLPAPTLLLSPKKNVIYGEFHSVVDSSEGNTGSGDTIEDQLKALIEQLNDIKNQADKKFDIWFGTTDPLPSKDNPTAAANYPASEWPTESLKALHAQDIFYNTKREPAANGGRAWRWLAVEEGGAVTYRWDEILDADTLASLEKIADVASDGIITGGAEKSRVFIDWKRAVTDYWEYKERAEDYGITTEWAAYSDAFLALARMLNDGKTLEKNQDGTWKTPAWLQDISADTKVPSAVTYRETWRIYYEKLAILVDAIPEKAKDLIDDIVSDGIITGGAEKSQLYQDWVRTKEEYFDYTDRAINYGFERFSGKAKTSKEYGYYQDYIALGNAFDALVLMLNGGTYGGGKEEVDKNFGQRTCLLYNGDELLWLQDLHADTKIGDYTYTEGGITAAYTPAKYRSLWGVYAYASTVLLNDFTEYSKTLADEALHKLEEIASDSVITPAEKNTILTNWLEVVTEYPLLYNQATQYINDERLASMEVEISTYRGDYAQAFTALGTALNGSKGTYQFNQSRNVYPLPYWISDERMSESEELTDEEKDSFNEAWSNYYAQRTYLQDLIAEASKKPGADALGELDNLAADNVLTPFEKLTVLREWDAATKEFANLETQATKAHISTSTAYTDYVNAYYQLGNYLYDLNKSTANRHVPYSNMSGSYLLQDGDTTIDGSYFKTAWSNYYEKQSVLLASIGNSKVGYYVTDQVPSAPYYEGDLWLKLNTHRQAALTLAETEDSELKICIHDCETAGQETERDWASFTEITEKRDPRIVLAAFAEKFWLIHGSLVSGNNYGYCVCQFGGSQPQTSRKGDMWWDANSGSMNFYNGSWYGSSNDALWAACRAVHEALGDYTLTLYTSQANTSHLYDLCCRTISFIDPFSRETVEGDVEVMMYGEAGWELLRESTRGLIENLGKQLRLCVLGGTANGTTAVSGLLTKSNISQLFAMEQDTNGKIITEAYMNVKIKDFVTADGVKTMISEAEISADRIKLTGSDEISMAIGSIASAQKQYGPNLLPNSIINETSTAYGFGNRSLRLEAGKKYTLSASGVVPTSLPSNMVLKVYIYRRLQDGDTIENGKVVGTDWAERSAACEITANGGAAQTGSVTFEADATCEWHISSYLYDRNHSNGTSGSGGTRTAPVTALWYKVEEGETATPWVAADSDDSGLDNFIVNPLAVSATIENNTDCTASEVTDSVFGRVLQISHNVNGHWQATFTRRDNYGLLTGRDATFYVICRDTSNNPEGRIADSSGNQVRKRLCFGYSGGSSTIICVDTYSSQFVDLGNGWRKYYATKKMDVALGTTIGICHTLGSWQVYAVGIVLGGVCPLVAEIMAKNALLSTGIDITTGVIELRADKVKFTSSDGKVTNKIWIDPTTGGLHAVDGEFSGKITATNGSIGGFTITENSISGGLGKSLILGSSPVSVEFKASKSTKSVSVSASPNSYVLNSYNFDFYENRRTKITNNNKNAYNWTNISVVDIMDIDFFPNTTSKANGEGRYYGFQYAMLGNGHVCLDGIVEGCALDVMNVFTADNQIHVIILPLNSNRITISTTHFSDLLILPDLTSLMTTIGVGIVSSAKKKCSFRLNIVNTGERSIYLAGRCDAQVGNLRPFDRAEYPNLFCKGYSAALNGSKDVYIPGYSVASVFLVYTGSEYNAYVETWT